MNIHEQIDQFLEKTPRQKTWIIFSVLVAITAVFGFIFYLGFQFGHGWADSDYLQEREKIMGKIAESETRAKVHEENETQLKAQNEILKKQNEATAEILKANDARIKGDAQKFEELNRQRTAKLEEINADNDYASQIKGICRDYRESGFGELSFCKNFEEK